MEKKSDKQKVLIKAPFQDYSGYASISRQFILELYKMHKFDLYLEPIIWINSGNFDLDPKDKAIFDELIEKGKHVTPADTTLVHFSIATEFFGEKSPYKNTFGYTMLETDKVSPTWAYKCNQMDAVFVPSTYCMSSFMQSNIIKPIRVVPFGIDFDKFTPEGPKLLDQLTTKYNFLFVGQWLQQGDRKNIIGTIRTFLNLFKDNPDVGLILKSYLVGAGTIDKMTIDAQIQGIRHQMGFKEDEGPKIYLVHGALTQESMIKLYRNADAFLLPTTGEAWGMPLLEAAAMELPIITTGGTGSEAFLNPKHTIMLSYEWKAIGYNFYWPGVYEPQQQLTIPNMEEFSRMVHRVYKHQDISKEQAKKQRAELIERDFTWKNAAKQLAKAIEDFSK